MIRDSIRPARRAALAAILVVPVQQRAAAPRTSLREARDDQLERRGTARVN